MVLTAEQQFRLRAKRALDTGDTTFKARGKNKEIFDTMKQEHDKTRAHKRARQQECKSACSSSSSYSSSSSSDSYSEKEEGQALSQDGRCATEPAAEADAEADKENCEEKKPERVAKWKLSSSNRQNWEMYLGYSTIAKLQDELAQGLVRMDPCTNDQAQISLRPILKGFTSVWYPVLLVELPEKEKMAAPEGQAQQAADDRLKAEGEEEKIIEANVDRFMHQIDAQNDARKNDARKLKMLAESAHHAELSHPFQEFFDKKAQAQAAKEGFVPGVAVFWNGNPKRKWHIEKIYCDRGDTMAEVYEPGDVIQHRAYHVSKLTLAEPAPGPVVEEVPEE